MITENGLAWTTRSSIQNDRKRCSRPIGLIEYGFCLRCCNGEVPQAYQFIGFIENVTRILPRLLKAAAGSLLVGNKRALAWLANGWYQPVHADYAEQAVRRRGGAG